MAGSTYGTNFTITTWENLTVCYRRRCRWLSGRSSHLQKNIQSAFWTAENQRAGKFTAARKGSSKAHILSGVFEGRTAELQFSILIPNEDQRSHDYGNIKDCYRPGHADYTFDTKYGFRDYQGGGALRKRPSDASLPGLLLTSPCRAWHSPTSIHLYPIGDIKIPASEYHLEEISENALYMPSNIYAAKAASYLEAA